MKILVYCQHVLGIGHLYRTLEIVRAMKGHEVILVLGGPPVQIRLPEHAKLVQLPGLQMDADFSKLYPVDSSRSLENVKSERAKTLFRLTHDFRPDCILIELFPFGRNGFSFELMPLLEAVRTGQLPASKIICSLRDILVEKKDQEKFEQRVIERLNSLFDALLVHGDPKIIRLNATFNRVADIVIPVIYTGYICEQTNPEKATAIRKDIHLQQDEKLIVVSAGGGNVGYRLLRDALRAYALLEFPVRMQIFTGPYLAESEYTVLGNSAKPGIRVDRFASDFPEWLSAADLSISMGGYNTTMNVLASGTPAIIFPFSQNREQTMRSEVLARHANLTILNENTLSPYSLAETISAMIHTKKKVPDILLEGAARTEQIISRLNEAGTTA